MGERLADGRVPTGIVIDETEEGPEPVPQGPYVLVVDDQQVLRDYLKRCLEEWGYSVRQAGTAIIALEIMSASPASVVLCDVRMPIHDGLWLAERLRARWPEVPIVMLTAIQDDETVATSRQLGVFDYLTKPVAPSQLREVVRRATSQADEDALSAVDYRSSTTSSLKELHTKLGRIEAEYSLECPVRCPTCRETLTTVKAVRLLRAHVNFTSTLPRRGRLIVCPHCLAVMPAELSNF